MLIMICLTTSVGALRLDCTPKVSISSNQDQTSNAYFIHPPFSTPRTSSARQDSLNQALVNPHLKGIPCLTSLSARRLPRSDLETLRREAYRALDAQVLGFCALDELLADFFEGLHFAGGEGYCAVLVMDTTYRALFEAYSGSCGFSVDVEISIPGRDDNATSEGCTYWSVTIVFLRLLVRHVRLF
jgi:hypothetical protein